MNTTKTPPTRVTCMVGPGYDPQLLDYLVPAEDTASFIALVKLLGSPTTGVISADEFGKNPDVDSPTQHKPFQVLEHLNPIHPRSYLETQLRDGSPELRTYLRRLVNQWFDANTLPSQYPRNVLEYLQRLLHSVEQTPVITTIRVICSEGPGYDNSLVSYDVPAEDFTYFIALAQCSLLDYVNPVSAFAHGVDFNEQSYVGGGIQEPFAILNGLDSQWTTYRPRTVDQLDPDLRAYLVRLLPQWLKAHGPSWSKDHHQLLLDAILKTL